jgi:hypothetical protein
MGSYAGVDWAADKHDVFVANEAGEELLSATFAHDEAGLRSLCRQLLRLKVQLVAIERPDGLLVERLLDAGLRVLALHPNQVAATRARFRVSGGKSDRFDAFVLCELARTDSHRFRVLEPDSDKTKALQALTRAREDLVKTRVLDLLPPLLERSVHIGREQRLAGVRGGHRGTRGRLRRADVLLRPRNGLRRGRRPVVGSLRPAGIESLILRRSPGPRLGTWRRVLGRGESRLLLVRLIGHPVLSVRDASVPHVALRGHDATSRLVRRGQIARAQRFISALHRSSLRRRVLCNRPYPSALTRSLTPSDPICLPRVTRGEQVIEQRSEVDHGLTQLLGAGLPATSSNRDLVRRSVVLDHHRMLHRYVGRPLLEVLFDWIAAVVHHSLHELVRLANGTDRLIHEVALRRGPLLQIAPAGDRLKRPDLERADSLPAVGQLLLGGALIATLCNDTTVLRPKLILQFPRPLLTRNENTDDRQQNDDNRQQHPNHGSTLLYSSAPGPSTADDLLA